LNIIPKCPICGNDARWFRGLQFYKYCSEICLKRVFGTKEHRKRMSDKLKIAHKEGRHPGWSFINKDISRRSYPEAYIHTVLKNNKLFEQFTIIEKLSFGKYFLDFAIIELKIDLEIDGQAHFRTKEAIEHDKVRDKYLIEHGWKVYRIAWIQFCKNKENEIEELFNYIKNNKNEMNRFYCLDEIQQQLNKKKKFGSNADRTRFYENEQKKLTPLILNSGINFSRRGWVKQVSKLIGLSSAKIRFWMKRFLPDLYETKCFKVKAMKRGVAQSG
jgi:very-short-patch-repair endonuclease